MKSLYISIAFAVVVVGLAALIGGAPGNKSDRVINIGHTGTPHLAPLFVAVDHGLFKQEGLDVDLKQFASTSDAGYALLAGRVDVAFIEPSKSFRLINENDQAGIKIAGTVNFAFGATLVVRDDLNIRLDDLEGMTVAAGSRYCGLLSQFKHDAERHGVNVGEINFVYTSFETMLPALEAGKVDAVLTRASYALLAQGEGHKILYQNWDVVSGDPCCPEYLAQVEYFMLVRDLDAQSVRGLDATLKVASGRPAEDSRKAVVEHTQLPLRLQQGFPVAHYREIGQELRQELGGWAWTEN
ncbi:MAG TPA: ABC transporter substrate-binding protein [Candidatus Limnocylindrales bacterium]|nr:ABC transporter substrate-binding protein [Candidatus Limnocylindrales bacterium]